MISKGGDVRLPALFFGAALVYALVAFLVMPYVLPEFARGFYAPHQLALVHLGALGWLGLTVVGATYQLLPVVLGATLRWTRAAWLSALLLIPAVIGLAESLGHGWPNGAAISGLALFVGVSAFALVVWRTMAAAPHRDLVAWHIGLASLFLLVAVTLGALLSLNKTDGALLGVALFPTIAAHATLMIAGWLSLTLAGVSVRLMAMFTLTEDQVNHRLLLCQLWLLGVGIPWLALAWGTGGALPHLPFLLITGGTLCLLVQLATLYHRRRRRKQVDVSAPFMAASFLFALAALLVVLLALDDSSGARSWVVAGWLVLAGWLGSAVQGFFYKISSFLLWLHRYAPIAGQKETPRLEDLYSRHLAWLNLALWTGGVLAVSIALALGFVDATRLAAVPVMLGGLVWLRNVVGIVIPRRTTQAPPHQAVNFPSS